MCVGGSFSEWLCVLVVASVSGCVLVVASVSGCVLVVASVSGCVLVVASVKWECSLFISLLSIIILLYNY